MSEQSRPESSDDTSKAASVPRAAAAGPHEPSLDATHDYQPSPEHVLAADSMAELLGDSTEQAGRQIGKYVVQGIIGHGGMGVVLKALDPDLNRVVAIKFLNRHLMQSPIARRRFQREARAAAAISHPNVLTIHSVEEQRDVPYLVMEFVSGKSLKDYILERGKLEAVETIRLSAQIAQGLAAAHAQGVIHRDVKPANVMLHEGATRARLMDFGLARVAFDNVELTSHDHAVGTPAYTAPEQVRGEPVDARADLFSLGCVMYAMLTGYSPFHGRAPAETVHRITSTEPPRLSDLDVSVPPVLAEIVERLLRKNPQERYQSAFEVADMLKRLLVQLNQTPTDELDDLLAGSHASSRGTRRPGKPAWWKQGTWAIAAVMAVAVLVWSLRSPDRDASRNQKPNDATINDHPSNPSSPSETAAGTASERLTEISVAQDGSARCKTLNEALSLAARNCTITVLDQGPYVETVTLEGDRFHGLKLLAAQRTTWKAPEVDEADLLSIRNVSHVTIRGFDMEVPGISNHAVSLGGALDDVTLENLMVTQSAEKAAKSLLVGNARSEGNESERRPVHVRHCVFVANGGSPCVWWDGSESPAWSLDLEDNRFEAHYSLVVLMTACRHVRIAGNVFVGGINAINMNFKSWPNDFRLEIVNNTFVKSQYWLGLINTFKSGNVPIAVAADQASRVCNNLILGGDRVQGLDEQWSLAFDHWQFAANWWERDASTKPNAGLDGRLAELKDSVEVHNRDNPQDPTYLVPVAGSPLLSSGCGGDLPVYIGARGPRAEAATPPQ